MANKAAFARASRAGHKAGKPGSAAYKAAFRKAFKRGGSRKRRRSAAPRAPRRRRKAMAKGKRRGGRRKGTVITPLRLAKAGVVLHGLSQAGPAVKEASYIVTHASQISKEGSGSVIKHAQQLVGAAAVPVVEVVVGPKVLDAVVKFASKGEPAIGRVARAKLVKV